MVAISVTEYERHIVHVYAAAAAAENTVDDDVE